MVVREMLFLLTIKSPYQNDEEILVKLKILFQT